MTTAADIIAKGNKAMAELATRPRKPPQTAGEAILVIEDMRRHTKSKPARIRMAEMALSIGNISPGARVVWLTYLAEERA
jgi:hypothetical protein